MENPFPPDHFPFLFPKEANGKGSQIRRKDADKTSDYDHIKCPFGFVHVCMVRHFLPPPIFPDSQPEKYTIPGQKGWHIVNYLLMEKR
jgi:hypothetical protein